MKTIIHTPSSVRHAYIDSTFSNEYPLRDMGDAIGRARGGRCLKIFYGDCGSSPHTRQVNFAITSLPFHTA